MPGRVSAADFVTMLPLLSGPRLRALDLLGTSAQGGTVSPLVSLCR
jgi:hypothetical protein